MANKAILLWNFFIRIIKLNQTHFKWYFRSNAIITLLKSTVLFSLLPPPPLPFISPPLLLSKFPGADCGEAKIPVLKNKLQISKENIHFAAWLCSFSERDSLLKAVQRWKYNVQGVSTLLVRLEQNFK